MIALSHYRIIPSSHYRIIALAHWCMSIFANSMVFTFHYPFIPPSHHNATRWSHHSSMTTSHDNVISLLRPSCPFRGWLWHHLTFSLAQKWRAHRLMIHQMAYTQSTTYIAYKSKHPAFFIFVGVGKWIHPSQTHHAARPSACNKLHNDPRSTKCDNTCLDLHHMCI